jgi:cytochrome oxidase assembly protein ShyY1
VLRRFLTPRWLGIHLLTITIVVIFCFFGRWQLHRWEHRGVTVIPADSRPAVALADLVSPDQPLPGGSIGRQATVTGRYDAAHQTLVADRDLAGRRGFWVLTPLRPDGGATGDSSALIVRGWVAGPTDPALRAPSTDVTITGRLYASEDPPPVGTGPTDVLPAGQFREVNTAELTGHFPYRILDGYLLLGSQTPTVSPAPAVLPIPVREVNRGGGLRNLAYALQWWLFAFAVLYFWSKLIRDDLAPERDRGATRPARETATTAPRIPAPTARRAQPATTARTTAPASAEEDAELAAYNRYLADLHARSGRSRS